MSDFSATDAAFVGIRFVREHPRTVAIWAGIQIVISLVVGVVAAATVGPYLVQMQALNQPGQRPDPAQVFGLMAHLAPMYVLFVVFMLLFQSVLHATMARAVLQPEEEGFAYIRFGLDEARQLLLALLVIAVAIGADVVATILVLVPSIVVSLAAGGLKPLVVFICVVIVLCAAIYLIVRLSLASPLTFATRRVNLFGSWTLTRGRVWKMLGTYLLVVGLALLIGLLALIIAVCVAVVLGGMGAAASLFQPAAASMGAFLVPARLAVSLLWAVVTPLFWALAYMPVSEIYRQLQLP
jgi:hypothetical protein